MAEFTIIHEGAVIIPRLWEALQMFWACARLQLARQNLAEHFLKLNGYQIYIPLVRERRLVRGRHVELRVPLFKGYAFVWIEAAWYSAHYCPGVIGLIRDGERPATVPSAVIDTIRSRERAGAIVIPKNGLRIGTSVRVTAGPFSGRVATVYGSQSSSERVRVLLELLGQLSRVELPRSAVEPVRFR